MEVKDRLNKINDPYLASLGRKIRIARKLQGLSQEEVAHRAGLGLAYYSRVERGHHNISILKLVHVALALDIALTEIIPKIDEIKINTD